jgi:hypothetical protein
MVFMTWRSARLPILQLAAIINPALTTAGQKD